MSYHFRFIHAGGIFLLVSAWVLGVIAIVGYLKWYRLFLPEILIHMGIILICLGFTGKVIYTSSPKSILTALGFRTARLSYFALAIVLTLGLWIADYWFQSQFLFVNPKLQARDLANTVNFYGVFSTSLTICLLAPIAEEMLFRGIILKALLDKLEPAVMVLISSLLFSFVHFSAPDALTLFLAAVFYGLLTIKSKSIFPALVSHCANNSITVFYLLTY